MSSCYFKEQDFCYVEDDADASTLLIDYYGSYALTSTVDGQYVDLTLNPERFTGYAGDSAHNVWRAIYEENCFGLSEASLSEMSKASVGISGLGSTGKSGLASAVVGAGGVSRSSKSLNGAPGWGFSKLSEGWGTEMVKAPLNGEEMCEEKKIYYRVISGELHFSEAVNGKLIGRLKVFTPLFLSTSAPTISIKPQANGRLTLTASSPVSLPILNACPTYISMLFCSFELSRGLLPI